MRLIREFGELFKFGDGAVVKEICSTMKQGSLQIRSGSDNQNVILWHKAFEVLRNGRSTLFNQNFG